MNLPFGARVLVHRTVIRVSVTHTADGPVFKVLQDRQEPRTSGRRRIEPRWLGEPIPADDGYDLEPGPPGAYTRLRRLSFGTPAPAIVIGMATRYEGAYHSPVRYGEDHEPGFLTDRRAVRLVEIALPPPQTSGTAWLALAWPEDLEVSP